MQFRLVSAVIGPWFVFLLHVTDISKRRKVKILTWLSFNVFVCSSASTFISRRSTATTNSACTLHFPYNFSFSLNVYPIAFSHFSPPHKSVPYFYFICTFPLPLQTILTAIHSTYVLVFFLLQLHTFFVGAFIPYCAPNVHSATSVNSPGKLSKCHRKLPERNHQHSILLAIATQTHSMAAFV